MKAGIQESTVALTDDAVRDVDSRMAAKSVKSESGGFGETSSGHTPSTVKVIGRMVDTASCLVSGIRISSVGSTGP